MKGRCPVRSRAVILLLAMASLAATVPREGGVARVYFPVVASDPNPEGLTTASDVFLSLSVFETMVRFRPDGTVAPQLARSWVVTGLEPGDADDDVSPEAQATRWIFELDPLARFPDGRPVRAEHIVASWELLLTSVRSPYRWLLDPVVGAREFRRGESSELEGLIAGEGTLELQLVRPAPDLLQRLAHPALGVHSANQESATRLGAGPFNPQTFGTLIGVNPLHRQGRPYLDGFEPVEPQSVDASLMLEAGQADLAVLYGRSAGQILSSSSSVIQMGRLPGWDRIYSLVWNASSGAPGKRGGFPSMLHGTLDRAGMVRYLFDGRGEPVGSLLSGSPQERGGIASGPAPLGGRVALLHDAADPAAISIASRLKASWEEVNLRVELEPLDADELWYRLASGDYLAAVLLHHPPATDPVLGLQGTLMRLGGRAAPALDALDFASRLVEPGARLEAARRAEDLLLRDEFLVPLVRVHAWLATSPLLVGARGGAAGVLYLQDAWWLPGRSRR